MKTRFALFRVALAILVCWDTCQRSASVVQHYTHSGFINTAQLRNISAADDLFADFSTLSVNSIHDNELWQLVLLATLHVLSLCLALGFHCRKTLLVIILLVASFQHRNPFICDDGDRQLLALLLFSFFLQLSAVWSIDSATHPPSRDGLLDFSPPFSQFIGMNLIVSLAPFLSNWTSFSNNMPLLELFAGLCTLLGTNYARLLGTLFWICWHINNRLTTNVQLSNYAAIVALLLVLPDRFVSRFAQLCFLKRLQPTDSPLAIRIKLSDERSRHLLAVLQTMFVLDPERYTASTAAEGEDNSFPVLRLVAEASQLRGFSAICTLLEALQPALDLVQQAFVDLLSSPPTWSRRIGRFESTSQPVHTPPVPPAPPAATNSSNPAPSEPLPPREVSPGWSPLLKVLVVLVLCLLLPCVMCSFFSESRIVSFSNPVVQSVVLPIGKAFNLVSPSFRNQPHESYVLRGTFNSSVEENMLPCLFSPCFRSGLSHHLPPSELNSVISERWRNALHSVSHNPKLCPLFGRFVCESFAAVSSPDDQLLAVSLETSIHADPLDRCTVECVSVSLVASQ